MCKNGFKVTIIIIKFEKHVNLMSNKFSSTSETLDKCRF